VVVLRVLVSETGSPLDIVVLERARGQLTEAAVEAVRGWSFDAAIKNGRPVQSWTIVRIPFEAIPFPQPSPTRAPEQPGSQRRVPRRRGCRLFPRRAGPASAAENASL
jgi:TonB family protein